MNPLKLKIENFCGYENSEISFDDISSILIVGKIRNNDKKSNGAGKSTIFNAIQYALFNEIAFSTLDKIVRRDTDSCRVSLDFISSVDNQTYRIVRSKGLKSGSDLRLTRKNGDEWENLTQTRNSETEKELEHILNINYKTFCNSVLFPQLDPTGLASISPGDRKKVLKEVLQLGVYSKYEAFAKKKANDLEKNITENRIILSTIGEPEKDILTLLTELQNAEASLKNKEEELRNLKEKEDAQKEKHKLLSDKIIEKEKRVYEYYSKKNAIIDEIGKISKLINDYNNKLSNITIEGKSMANSISKIEESIITMRASLSIDEAVRDRHNTVIKDIAGKRAIINSDTPKLEELRIPLPKDNICKHCRQHTSDEAREVCKAAIAAEILATENKLTASKLEVIKLELEQVKLTAQINDIDKTNALIKDGIRNIEVKTKEIEIKRKLYAEYSDTIERNNNRIITNKEELELLKKSVNDGSKEQFVKDKEDRDGLHKVVLEIIKAIEVIRVEITDISNKNAVLKERMIQKTKDTDRATEIKSLISKLEIDYSMHQKVVQAFGPSGIPALITHSVLDDLQIESNNLLGQFRPGLQIQFFIEKERTDGDLSDTLGINFILDGFELEYAQLSGAQKIVSSLALKLGLAAILKKRLGSDIKLLLIDEVDQSLDEENLELFEKTIRLLQKSYKILIITHSNDLKSRFQKAIVVEQDENFVSTATVVNSW